MRLLAVLKTTAGEQKQLRMQYELENTGELTFYQRMAVKQMLENLQLTEQYDTQIALPEIYLWIVGRSIPVACAIRLILTPLASTRLFSI